MKTAKHKKRKEATQCIQEIPKNRKQARGEKKRKNVDKMKENGNEMGIQWKNNEKKIEEKKMGIKWKNNEKKIDKRKCE